MPRPLSPYRLALEQVRDHLRAGRLPEALELIGSALADVPANYRPSPAPMPSWVPWRPCEYELCDNEFRSFMPNGRFCSERCRRNGAKRRRRLEGPYYAPPPPQRACADEGCGRIFQPNVAQRRYCSATCQRRAEKRRGRDRRRGTS